ncbi:beta-lactamase family protein [Undibacterium sp. LX40W]|uniref:Beta-lactamase family protein n=1 Tax=Undibacterium nitidum TaxID=2762298 RepID=A0A923KPJ7_9BURK|nr:MULTISPECIES: serine hydrolase domain-containing protein [Undibacterium]MBC3881883.1 beta-lactamase family protein [Undibacterium nitidum]MBC3892120.1 beta-lactamase family protein [Undibacterium sp. LX40W]
MPVSRFLVISRPAAILLMMAATAHVCAQSIDEQIKRVTTTLTPSIVIKGTPEKTHTLADSMTKYKVPGVSIAVINDGKLAWAHGFGVKAADSKDPVTATTLFQAASISKPVAATAMLRLVEQGKFALDTPINTYLKTWQLPDNEFTKTEAVTLRRIISHSAGLNGHGFPGYASGVKVPTVQQILDGKAPANTQAVRVEMTPGTKWKYSGGGTTIMQLAMTETTGEAFPALVQRLVLGPIGMKNSAYEQPLSNAKQKLAATGHDDEGKPIPGRWHTYPELAAAGLWTTPTDLSKWAIEITEARAGKSTKTLSQKMATEMLTEQKAPSGLGPMLGGAGEAMSFEHGGSNEGYRCFIVYFPVLGRGAVVMTNGEGGGMVYRQVLSALAKEYHWPSFKTREIEPIEPSASILEQLIGECPIPPASPTDKPPSVLLTQENGKMMVEIGKFMPKTEIVLLANDDLIVLENGFELKLIRGNEGRVSHLMLGATKIIKK